ncbi:FUSC family protein [Pontibacillus litoralis]|uniref:Aromatic acid exporter family protein n=1 Tax=Pontibacillus litoralis JSM 072002 TaxID=1385512 RepID=A0A0A5GC55_9BACI|nr:aromatic acid exporter family protein [Pontibacillus litoralis]KGX88783.1 hypothetical protein N784_00075 [Pontibacillus litoralis JSM 072002]
MVQSKKRGKLFGGRTLKTGISVFLTTLFCTLLNWPVIYAAITAIVTVENTASDSIKKAKIRFPAAAIGAFFAAVLYMIFGQIPLTYALAAMLTIAICHKLRLDDGIIVATLTAVAMIPDFQNDSIVSFLIRLGTTSIGIIVSTIVNFIILPPDYSKQIYRNVHQLYDEAATVLEKTVRQWIEPATDSKQIRKRHRQLTAKLERTYQLSTFQREEWKYHRHSAQEMKAFQFAQKKLHMLQQIVYHLGNLQFVELDQESFTPKEKQLIATTITTISQILRTSNHFMSTDYFKIIEQLDTEFWQWKEEHIEQHGKYRHHFPAQTIVYYELLCLHDLLEELRYMAQDRYQLIEIDE